MCPKGDVVQALTGRFGPVVGKDFAYGANKKGQVYVKGGYIYEICGKAGREEGAHYTREYDVRRESSSPTEPPPARA